MLDLAESAGIDGVVCSPHELKLVKKKEIFIINYTRNKTSKIQMMIKKEL